MSTKTKKTQNQRSPIGSQMQDAQEVDLEDDDYDEETDEFAGYSGSNANQYAQ
jgi:hypothetical protein